MKYLSLFSGASGGDLGLQQLLGWQCLGYVEYEAYCQKVLKQRIKDGVLDAAPIFGDIRKFISEGFAKCFTGMVDAVTAGFPCQPFSTAGKQRGSDDSRNMWPATAGAISVVKPRYVLLENVQGIRPYLPMVIRDLRRMGHRVEPPIIFGANELGAWHRRKRIWILAYPSENRQRRIPLHIRRRGSEQAAAHNFGKIVKCKFKRPEDFKDFPNSTYFHRKHDVVADWMDRIEAIGNGQVPAVAAAAWNILTNNLA